MPQVLQESSNILIESMILERFYDRISFTLNLSQLKRNHLLISIPVICDKSQSLSWLSLIPIPVFSDMSQTLSLLSLTSIPVFLNMSQTLSLLSLTSIPVFSDMSQTLSLFSLTSIPFFSDMSQTLSLLSLTSIPVIIWWVIHRVLIIMILKYYRLRSYNGNLHWWLKTKVWSWIGPAFSKRYK